MTDDKQKIALVTGAAGVLGLETARGLAADGYRVVMVDLDQNRLETLAQEIGQGAYPLPLDVADPQKVAEACATIRQELGRVSVLVNNAGVLSNNKTAETSDDEWRHILSINLDGAFYLCREWLSGMKTDRWGRIVNMCSLAIARRYRQRYRTGLHKDPDGDGAVDRRTAPPTDRADTGRTVLRGRRGRACGTVSGISPIRLYYRRDC